MIYPISLTHYLILAAIIFNIGIFGVFLNRKNLIIILMSIELMLLAVNINFIAFSTHLNIILGQVFALFILTVAAAEAAIGLAILVVFFRSRGSIAVDDANSMKG
jgi:NADH-quinone oxidoreductase subunit K